MPSMCPCGNPRIRPGDPCSECRKTRWKRGSRKVTQRTKAPPEPPPVFDRDLTRAKRFIVTAAQNNTPVRKDFLAALQVAAKRLRAELIVIPYRYKNPTAWDRGADLRQCGRPIGSEAGVFCKRRPQHSEACSITPDRPELWWDPAVRPFFLNTRKELCRHLVLAADLKLSPTASSPLSSLEAVSGEKSCLVGHPKLQLKAVAVPSGRMAKLVATTGAVTDINYSNTKAGGVAEFHYTLGAQLVEVDGEGFFHLRQLLGDRHDGSFDDVTGHYSADGHRPLGRVKALVLGDAHARFMDPAVERATFGAGGIVDTLDPEELVFHDLLDGYAGNPHHKGKPFVALAKARAKRGNVEEEVRFTVEKLMQWARGRSATVVPSNHDNFLERWVENGDWKTDPLNMEFYLETALMMARSTKGDEGGATWADPFAYWVRKLSAEAENIRCLAMDESHTVAGIEVGMHGHLGPNGARGSVKNLSRLGQRCITGHGHSPAIEEGHWRVGTSTRLKLEYNHGPSSWLNSHIIIYPSGKRCILTIVDGRWRLR